MYLTWYQYSTGYKTTITRNYCNRWIPWMKEEKGIIHRGEGAHLRCPVSTTVQFSLRNEGSSEYMCLCEGRESLCPNFQTFQDPRHQFHGIGRLVWGLLFRGLFIATYASGNDSWEIFALLKGTQDWDFFWLRFWNLYYLFISYVKILIFYKNFFWSGHYWGRYNFSA